MHSDKSGLLSREASCTVEERRLSTRSMCALKLAAMPAVAAGVIVLFAAMPTDANACIVAVQYQRLVNPVSGAGALRALPAAAAKLPVVVRQARDGPPATIAGMPGN